MILCQQATDADKGSGSVSEPLANDQNAAPNTCVAVKQEPLDDDDDYEEYNYPVKPVVVYSDDETEEEKPVPIFHLSEPFNQLVDGSAPAQTFGVTEALNENNDSCESLESCEDVKPRVAEEEDVKPLPLADKPSLRALLLTTMALNFSQ